MMRESITTAEGPSERPSQHRRVDRREMLTNVQYRILKKLSPGAPECCSGGAYEGKSKLEILMGREFLSRIPGKIVIDFGCGEGADAIEMANRGARKVIGVDIREDVLQSARQRAQSASVENLCDFA